MEQELKICKTCYRELPEDQMTSIDICRVCKDIIGKGDGYGEQYTDEQAEKWFEGSVERMKKLEEEGKI